MTGLLTLLFFVALGWAAWQLLRRRWRRAGAGAGLSLVLLVLVGVTAPPPEGVQTLPAGAAGVSSPGSPPASDAPPATTVSPSPSASPSSVVTTTGPSQADLLARQDAERKVEAERRAQDRREAERRAAERRAQERREAEQRAERRAQDRREAEQRAERRREQRREEERREEQPTTATSFANCKALNQVYAHGVGRPGAIDLTSGAPPVTTFKRSLALYQANTGRDRDEDGIACERR